MTEKNNSYNNIWLLDGGTGREIERRGGPFRQPEWSALSLYKDPEIVYDIHSSFIQAGSNAITTNTYATVPFHLGRERYDKDAKWLLKLAVDLAVRAKDNDKKVQVLGSIPPISGSYNPGSFDEAIAGPIIDDFLEAFHGNVDALLLETMGSSQEAKFALEKINQFYDSHGNIDQTKRRIPVYISFYVQAAGDDTTPKLLTGDTLTEAVDYLEQCGLLDPKQVPLIMVNCCDINLVDAALQELSHALNISNNNKPQSGAFQIGAYPNAFSAPPTEAANEKARKVDTSISPERLRDMTQRWNTECGATVFGGCCGIGPDHIQALSDWKNHKTEATAVGVNYAAICDTTQNQRLLTPPTKAVLQCSVKGCGCGVQIGFGQAIPFLCGNVSITDPKGGSVS